MRTIDDYSADEIENHKDHDKNIDIVPQVCANSVIKPNLKQKELTPCKTKTGLDSMHYIHERPLS